MKLEALKNSGFKESNETVKSNTHKSCKNIETLLEKLTIKLKSFKQEW